MSDVMLYDVLGNDWRWGQDEHGVYAVAADVAKSFDYRDAANALRVLDADEKGTQIVSTSQVRARGHIVHPPFTWVPKSSRPPVDPMSVTQIYAQNSRGQTQGPPP